MYSTKLQKKVTSTTVNDLMWRMNVEALKTGSVVEKYDAHWMRTDCIFCVREFETPAHPFVECPALKRHQDILIQGVKSLGLIAPAFILTFKKTPATNLFVFVDSIVELCPLTVTGTQISLQVINLILHLFPVSLVSYRCD